MKKSEKIFNLKVRFNDIFIQELGLGLTEDNDYLYNIDTNSILQISEKFIKYFENPDPLVRHNEIELNLLENPRLAETISMPYIINYINNHGYIFHSASQDIESETGKGRFVISYIDNNIIKQMYSELFANDSVRILDFITRNINKTSHFYDLSKFDIDIKKR